MMVFRDSGCVCDNNIGGGDKVDYGSNNDDEMKYRGSHGNNWMTSIMQMNLPYFLTTTHNCRHQGWQNNQQKLGCG